MMTRISKWARWFLVAVVKPIVIFYIAVQGVPPSIRALGGSVNAVIKTLKHDDNRPTKSQKVKKKPTAVKSVVGVGDDDAAR